MIIVIVICIIICCSCIDTNSVTESLMECRGGMNCVCEENTCYCEKGFNVASENGTCKGTYM